MSKLVLIVDPRNLVLRNESSSKRHKLYADRLSLVSQGEMLLGVIRFKNGKNFSIEQDGNLLVINLPKNPIYLFFSLNKCFNSSFLMNTKVLVAGDPWESFIMAGFIQRILKSRPKIQTQIHGDIGNIRWIQANIRNRFRAKLAIKTLSKTDQVRATSNRQAKSLVSRFNLSPSKIKVSPVPSLLPEITASYILNDVRPATLGFVGRIQNDRGLSEFLQLVTKLSESSAEFSVVIVGAGPKRKILESELTKALNPSQVTFLGELKLSEMEGAWQQIGVLVSTAPTESYGRAIREAIFNGVPVWAIPSTGVTSLKESMFGDGVQLLNLDQPPSLLRAQFAALRVTKIKLEDRQELARLDKEAVSTLIDSWLELIS